MTSELIACELVTALSTKFGTSSDFACMRHASVNNVAIHFFTLIYPSLIDVPCFSHTLNLVGEHFKVSTVSEFVSSWMSARSAKAKLVWKDIVGSSAFILPYQMVLSAGSVTPCNGMLWNVEPFLDNIDTAPATTAKLHDIEKVSGRACRSD